MLEYIGDECDGKRTVVCSGCGFTRNTHWPIEMVHHNCSKKGPGGFLIMIIGQIGARPDNCNGECNKMARQMDEWGPAGCRDHREEILQHLRAAYSKTDWPTVFAAALAGSTHLWLVRRINPLHPIESGLSALLDEAIRRAEQAAAD